jgi:hypothetical protein
LRECQQPRHRTHTVTHTHTVAVTRGGREFSPASYGGPDLQWQYQRDGDGVDDDLHAAAVLLVGGLHGLAREALRREQSKQRDALQGVQGAGYPGLHRLRTHYVEGARHPALQRQHTSRVRVLRSAGLDLRADLHLELRDLVQDDGSHATGVGPHFHGRHRRRGEPRHEGSGEGAFRVAALPSPRCRQVAPGAGVQNIAADFRDEVSHAAPLRLRGIHQARPAKHRRIDGQHLFVSLGADLPHQWGLVAGRRDGLAMCVCRAQPVGLSPHTAASCLPGAASLLLASLLASRPAGP